jgi:hypothetical protein
MYSPLPKAVVPFNWTNEDTFGRGNLFLFQVHNTSYPFTERQVPTRSG